jgi:hypothetical protein
LKKKKKKNQYKTVGKGIRRQESERWGYSHAIQELPATSPGALRGSAALHRPGCQTSELHNCFFGVSFACFLVFVCVGLETNPLSNTPALASRPVTE